MNRPFLNRTGHAPLSRLSAGRAAADRKLPPGQRFAFVRSSVLQFAWDSRPKGSATQDVYQRSLNAVKAAQQVWRCAAAAGPDKRTHIDLSERRIMRVNRSNYRDNEGIP
jgi:hypothetical protein